MIGYYMHHFKVTVKHDNGTMHVTTKVQSFKSVVTSADWSTALENVYMSEPNMPFHAIKAVRHVKTFKI